MSLRSTSYWVFAFALLATAGAASAGDGLVALQTADPPCTDDSGNIFADCGNGTVTDTRTGLIWLKNASCFGEQTRARAFASAAGLGMGQCGLTDGSQAGDWRLPSDEEWETILKPSCAEGPKIIGNGSTTAGCHADSPWATGVEPMLYWSSTTDADGSARYVLVGTGVIIPLPRSGSVYVWPVRGGPLSFAPSARRKSEVTFVGGEDCERVGRMAELFSGDALLSKCLEKLPESECHRCIRTGDVQ